ncbi:hypothetical protein MTBPR1_40260 [Candidatus Terasakiella magnetica]|uniref:Uncharacterized protein n=1 Tax=Candidatus Terasakiella magnetica TaxID=1867952 RepID=A0A1C3RIZ9_9PROT|nr:hypothetical protein MTBPR1_40260 [Candidatus Terasakiella magnetica]
MAERWSGRGDSNARPKPWQGFALPLSYARLTSLAIYVLEDGAGEAIRTPDLNLGKVSLYP